MVSTSFFAALAIAMVTVSASAQGLPPSQVATLMDAKKPTSITLPPAVTINRLYGGADGESHLEKIDLPRAGGAESRSVSTRLYATDVEMGYSLPGTFIDWHGVSTPRLLIILSGTMEIGLGDGSKHLLKAGDIVLAMDMTGHGHTSRVVGDTPALAMTVRLPKDDPLKLKLSSCPDNMPAADCVANKAVVTGPQK